MQQFGEFLGANAGGIGNLISQLAGKSFGGEDPYAKAAASMANIPQQMWPYYQPYIGAGLSALSGMQPEYQNLINNPGERLNQIASGYQKSPGFDFSMKQALDAARHASAAGGMAGSPMHEQQSMDIAQNLASRDFNNWLSQALGLHNQGLAGNQSIYNTGAQAGTDFGASVGSNSMNQALMQMLSGQQKEKEDNSLWGTLGGLVASALPMFF